MPDGSVVTLDISVLLRLSGLGVVQGDTLLLGPDHQRGADVFRAVASGCSNQWRNHWQLDPYRQRLAAPFDDLVQRPDDPLGREREVDLDAQTLAVEVIQHIQKPELAAIGQTISHEPKVRAAKSIDQTVFGGLSVKQSIQWIDCSENGTLSSSGFSRLIRRRGLIRKFNSSSQ